MGGKKVCIVGSGNWGSAIAKIVGSNAAKLDKFDTTVNMWVFEEEVGGKKLTEIINTQHENVKYLPGHKLPPNVVAVPDVLKASADADILIFVVPHQFIGKLCDQMKGHIKKDAIGVSLIKGVDEGPDGLKLISEIIREQLGIEMSVLMGANIANEVAEEKFCETTIGCRNLEHGQILKELMQTPNFRITVVKEADTVEICGALKVQEEFGSRQYTIAPSVGATASCQGESSGNTPVTTSLRTFVPKHNFPTHILQRIILIIPFQPVSWLDITKIWRKS